MREEVERLLRYPDHTAGGIMTTEFVRLDPAMTVRDALRHIRSVAREKESIFSCYVMEPETGKLQGALSLRDLVMAELEQRVSEVMRRRVISVVPKDDQEVVAQKLAKYNLLAVPVVEEDGRMVGFVTVDDVIDVLIEEGTEDVLKMAAVNPDAGGRSYFEFPLTAIVRSRVGWLLLLFVAGSLTSAVLRHYEGELATAVALSFFIPLLIGTGGNAGSQAVMTVIRSLALGEIGVRHAWRVVAKEATVGGLLGALIGVVAFGAARFWGAEPTLAATVALSMFAICVWSTTVGSLIPIAAQRVGVDPAVLSAPLISTLVDATGLVIYFEIAKTVLRL
jgi:magnesium transporter